LERNSEIAKWIANLFPMCNLQNTKVIFKT